MSLLSLILIENLIIFIIFSITTIECVTTVTNVDRSFNTHLIRKKRFFLYPKSSVAAMGMSVSKRVIQPSPVSTNIVLSVGVGYALPTKVGDWKPKFRHYGSKKKPAQRKDYCGDKDNRCYWNESNHIDGKDYLPKINSIKDRIWTNKPTYKDVFLYRPVITNEWREQIKPYKRKIWKHKSNNIRYRPIQNTIPIYDEQFDHRSHRERREIFTGIEMAASKFGYNIRACILRTICEVKHFLLPPGKSMIQDIIRTVFEIPTKSHWNDDYSKATRANETDCRHLYKNKCPISVLEYALHSQMDISKL